MTPTRIQVFFYGLFMDVDVLRAKGAQPVNPRSGRVSGFALRIGHRATLKPDPDAEVYGILMELSHEEIQRVYADPGVGEYRPEAVAVELADGTYVPALCFNLPAAPCPEEVNAEYALRLRDLAARVGLPASYVKTIR